MPKLRLMKVRNPSVNFKNEFVPVSCISLLYYGWYTHGIVTSLSCGTAPAPVSKYELNSGPSSNAGPVLLSQRARKNASPALAPFKIVLSVSVFWIDLPSECPATDVELPTWPR